MKGWDNFDGWLSKARLEAKPWAKYCVEYARKLEQGLVIEEEQDEEEDSP